uniref:7,8-dihydroneopterin aldolase n=1 Tax=Candidatus Kentrum sp. SD TaxID=2126332 RepID=A0A450YQP6_9GAMM|nr:MAG: dihydroneopterin aldolase [Candidatus Kentron sp. SD]VFK43868.1 MAG: dihydroneopterin aldolase [Candidatus Kentron sp. SD]VFK78521.1 MAG: dihydroneopterin aldolase [Candidatus Kentron sp. SD]
MSVGQDPGGKRVQKHRAGLSIVEGELHNSQNIIWQTKTSDTKSIIPMDIIYLHGLRTTAIIGVFPWERQIRQTVILDLDMAGDVAKAAATDRIEDTLDYKAVAKRVIDFVEKSEFQLVETLAEKVAKIIIEEFQVSWLRLRLNKAGAIRDARDVGIIIERGTQE